MDGFILTSNDRRLSHPSSLLRSLMFIVIIDGKKHELATYEAATKLRRKAHAKNPKADISIGVIGTPSTNKPQAK